MTRFALARGLAALAAVLVAVSLSGACSNDPGTAEPETAEPPGEGAEGVASPVTDGVDSVDEGPDNAGPEAGEAAPLHTPARGEPLAVVGVAFDETIAMRSEPSPDAPVVAELPALFDRVVGTGQGRTADAAGWWRIRVGQARGWVEASSMARLGATIDVTADVVDALGGAPDAPNLRALGRVVAEARLGADADAQARAVLSGAPATGELAEVVYDIVGGGDVSVAGERLVVFATPTDDGGGFVLRSVEATVFCARGVIADGRCA